MYGTRKDDWAQKPHFSEAVKQEASLHDMVCAVPLGHDDDDGGGGISQRSQLSTTKKTSH